MKRPNRNIEIFSVSALDLFASAMGAFLVVAVILFPYYLNTSDEDMRKRLQQLNGQLKACQQEGALLQKQLETLQKKRRQAETAHRACEIKLTQTYLAIVINWPTRRHDIDLHIITPNGREFYYGRHNRTGRHFPSIAAELSADTVRGPGIEIWEMAVATPGAYKVYYRFFSKHGNRRSAPVRGRVFYRNGSKNLRNITLTRKGQKSLVSTVIVKPDGQVEIR